MYVHIYKQITKIYHDDEKEKKEEMCSEEKKDAG